MPTFLALLLSLWGCKSHPPVETTASKDTEPLPVSTQKSPAAPEPHADSKDAFAPFAVASQLEIPLPDYLYSGGFQRRGAVAAPVNTEETDLDFFTDPAFDKGENSGRLFSSQVTLFNPYKPKLPERSVVFICWRPVSEEQGREGTAVAQLLPWREDYAVLEVTTDGKRLFVQFTPAYGTKGKGKFVDTYVWKGDLFGHGRFVPEGNKPFPLLAIAAPTAFEEEHEAGFWSVSTGRYQEAIEAFEKAIALKPGDASSHYGLGLALEGSGQPAGSERARKAVASFTRAIELDPRYVDAWRERGVRYWMEKQFDKAIEDATHVIALEPKTPQGYIQRSQYYAESRAYDKAATDALVAVRLNPEEREYWELLAQHQYHGGRYPEAIKSARSALNEDDSRNVARLVLACIYARQEQREKALEQVQAAYDNGITYDERRDGLRELKRALGAQPNSTALKAVYQALSGPDHLEPNEDE